MNKKAIEINVATIIIVILAILVLVILALYFTGGMKSLWSKITPVPGAYEQTDVENARNACTLLCTAGQSAKTAYCEKVFQIRLKDSTETKPLKCWDYPIYAHKEQECKDNGFGDAEFCENILQESP